MDNFIDFKIPNHGNLSKWKDQGILLLNLCMTVSPNIKGSHLGRFGWEQFNTQLI